MKTAWKVILGILAAIVVLLIVAEAGIRMFMANQISSGVIQSEESAAIAQAEPEVSFGTTPVVFGLLGGQLPHMTVTTPSTLVVNGDQIAGAPASTIELNNVEVTAGDPIAETFRLSTELPNEFVRAMLNQQLEEQMGQDSFLSSLITVSDVSSNPEQGTFTITFTSGVAGIELRPVQTEGQLAFEATSTQLFGVELPQGVAESLTEAMSTGLQEDVTGGMRVENFTVIPGGLRVTMAGEHVNFAELAQMQQNQLQPAQ